MTKFRSRICGLKLLIHKEHVETMAGFIEPDLIGVYSLGKTHSRRFDTPLIGKSSSFVIISLTATRRRMQKSELQS